jgi:hypothetical protein
MQHHHLSTPMREARAHLTPTYREHRGVDLCPSPAPCDTDRPALPAYLAELPGLLRVGGLPMGLRMALQRACSPVRMGWRGIEVERCGRASAANPCV